MKEDGHGGNAIKNSTSIKGNLAGEYGNNIVDLITKSLNIKACTLGSTGKKPETSESNDIDIAIELDFTENNINNVKSFLSSNFNSPEIVLIKGLKIMSWGLNYVDQDVPKIVQVDLMFCNNVEYASFMYHSPNFINNESNFKGLFRTNLMVICASNIPVDQNTYATEYFDNGEIKSFWKYSLTYSNGLRLTHKTYQGKKKVLKNPIKIEEDTIKISDNIDNILSIIFGNEVTKDDVNSFESIVKYLYSNKYVYKSKEQLQKIFEDFFNDNRHQGNTIITENLHKVIDNYEKNNI